MKKIKIIFIVLFLSFSVANADTIQTVGSAGQFIIPGAGLLIALYKHDKQGILELGLAYGTTLAAVYGLKSTINRTRPDGGSWSFPSGHTASAFAGAAFLQQRYGWNYGAPAYAGAWFVGLSRVYAQRHWPTDVLAGAAIGIAANLVFTKPYHHVRIQPFALHEGAGINFSLVK